MGDRRFQVHYDGLLHSADRQAHIRDMSDGAIVEALAAASRENDPYMANVLATEATNRMDRARTEVRHLGEGICSLDAGGRILSANPAAEELLGRTQAELQGQDFDSLCRDGDKGGGRKPDPAYLAVLTAGVVVECETELFYRQDGSAFDVSYTAAPIVKHGEVTGVVIAFRDISVRKHAQDALRVSEERYRALFESSSGFVFSADLQGRVDAASASAQAITGRAAADLQGRSLRSLAAPEDREAVDAIFLQACRGKSARASISLLHEGGDAVPTSLLLMPVILRGEIVGVYAMAEGRAERG